MQSPELLEDFTVMLTNASKGRIDPSAANSVISIASNDFPYGLFTFSVTFRPLSVSEGAGDVVLVATREFGSTGVVAVDYMTVSTAASKLVTVVIVYSILLIYILVQWCYSR